MGNHFSIKHLRKEDEEEIMASFNKCNKNKDGYLGYKDFLSLGKIVWRNLKKLLNEKERYELFNILCSIKRINDLHLKRQQCDLMEEESERMFVEIYVNEFFRLHDENNQNKANFNDFMQFISQQTHNLEVIKTSDENHMWVLMRALYEPSKVNIRNAFCYYDNKKDLRVSKSGYSKLILDISKVRNIDLKLKDHELSRVFKVVSGLLMNFDKRNEIHLDSRQFISLVGYEAHEYIPREKKENQRNLWKNIDKFIEEQYPRYYFRDFLRLELCEENMDFVIAVKSLQSNFSVQSAVDTFEKFKDTLPLTHQTTHKLQLCFSENSFTPNSFDEALLEVVNTLRGDSFLRFFDSIQFDSFLKFNFSQSIE